MFNLTENRLQKFAICYNCWTWLPAALQFIYLGALCYVLYILRWLCETLCETFSKC